MFQFSSRASSDLDRFEPTIDYDSNVDDVHIVVLEVKLPWVDLMQEGQVTAERRQ